MKNDKRKTARFLKNKTLKVFRITFAEFTKKGEEYMNIDEKIVLAETAYSAMSEAVAKISEEEKKTYYVQEVELLNVID